VQQAGARNQKRSNAVNAIEKMHWKSALVGVLSNQTGNKQRLRSKIGSGEVPLGSGLKNVGRLAVGKAERIWLI
jgi:hypothetical protein